MMLSIIIPVYNEQDSLETIVERVMAVELGNIEIELVISNDGSRDNTFQIIEKLQAKYPDIICYHSPTNLGKGAAVRLGITISSGDLITLQDADIELNSEEYPLLLAPVLDQKSQGVYGSHILNSKVKVNRTSLLAPGF
jgi:glycosyltransferase involved in cell wall biosynthesis